MPTAARLVSAVAMAIVTAAMAILFVGVYPEEPWDTKLNAMIWTFGICGALVGWFSLGKRAEQESAGSGIVLGFRAAITVSVLIIFVLSTNFMFAEILAERLRGARPMEAIFVMFDQAGVYTSFIINPVILGVGLVVYVIVGVLARKTYFTWN